jgi:hypothetical protein
LFVPLKQHLAGRRLHSDEEVQMAVCERVRIQEPDFYRDGIFKHVRRWGKYINVLRDYVEKQ